MACDVSSLSKASWQTRALQAEARCRQLEAMVEELRTINQRQQQQINEQQQQITALQQQVADLQRRLARSRKNSSNSSKPPSSDIVKPPAKTGGKGSKRPRRGAQPGHPMHDPLMFEAEQISDVQRHELTACPNCGQALQLTDNAPKILQKVELVDLMPWTVTEHQAYASWCPHCQQVHYASLPTSVERGGMLGPKLLAYIAYLKAVHHASYSTIRRHFRDVLKLPISRGRLDKAVKQVSEALEDTYEQLRAALVDEPTLRIDETGHKDNGRRFWTWCFRAARFTCFRVDKRRSSAVLWDILGDQFAGVFSCDYFSAYRKYMHDCDVLVQFCLAHLIRDLKYLTTLPDAATAAYGRRLLDKLGDLFALIHSGQTPHGMPAATLRIQLTQASERIIRSATMRVPDSSEAQAIAKRFKDNGQAYFQFILTPDIEPTNNLAEQALRFVVIDRHITQGTRSDTGQRWCERIWTVIATCAQQGRSVMQYLTETVTAWVNDLSPPSLLPQPTST